MSEAEAVAATTTEEQKHDVEYASEETKNAVSIHYNRQANRQKNERQVQTFKSSCKELGDVKNFDALIFGSLQIASQFVKFDTCLGRL